MNLTRDQAISEHRKMWNWISYETKRKKRRVGKNEYFCAIGINNVPNSGCYCCEFHVNNNEVNCGDNCIIDWGKNVGCLSSYFLEWNNTTDWEESARLARIIANLPERKENAD